MSAPKTPEGADSRAAIETSGRRAFLSRTLGVTAGLVGAAVTAGAYAVPASAQKSRLLAAQDNWRFCQKCFGMFYWDQTGGRCPVGSGHVPYGFNFVLPHSVPPTSTAQNNWRFCQKCFGMFYWDQTGGRCPVGSGHVPYGFNFVLPHSVPPTSTAQNNWRFCQKCFGMFYWDQTGGRCPVGSGHVAYGFNFVLPHYV
ncbi:hypothetical protein AB0B56_18875 [Streptosporangium canum]|uniref:hypothetical protein n=1 Tax=Streptosporangium canum TaxID=324952 RepID=UPI003447C2B2